MSKILAPTVHLNGTSRAELVEGYKALRNALFLATGALDNTYPNGRDYYPQGPDAINAAMEQHRSRVRRLADIQAEIATILQSPGLE